jgi:uncharacterized protein (DUF1697 family)
MTRFASFLRGINVGGKNIISMKDLVRIHESLGYHDVKPYLQSGNVCFSAGGEAKEIAEKIEAALARATDTSISVFVRTSTELTKTLRDNPYSKETEATPEKVFVMFTSGSSPIETKELEEVVHPGESYSVKRREVYLYLSNGAGRAKLTLPFLERKFGVKGTMRNMNTVKAVSDMLREK